MRRRKNHNLKELYDNQVLRTQAESLVRHGASYRQIRKFLGTKNFPVSLSLIQKFVKRYKHALKTHSSISETITHRKNPNHKKNIDDLKKNGQLDTPDEKILKRSLARAKQIEPNIRILPRDHYYTIKSVLDREIDRYNNQMKDGHVEKGEAKAGQGAIKLELQFPHSGAMSIEAIKQFEILSSARFDSINEISQEMLPPDKFKVFCHRVNKLQEKLINNTLQITPEGRRLYVTLKSGGMRI